MSLQVGEMPDLNPGLQVLQSGALPLSHHIPLAILTRANHCYLGVIERFSKFNKSKPLFLLGAIDQ